MLFSLNDLPKIINISGIVLNIAEIVLLVVSNLKKGDDSAVNCALGDTECGGSRIIA